MKQLFSTFLLVSLMGSIQAAETRAYTKINSSEATVVIATEERSSTQAAIYVDGKENERFIQEMFKDSKSKLFQIRQAIEKENCNKNSTPDKTWIDGCGEVTLTKEVRTAFGRGGWASGAAGYTFFIGFTSEGSGRFFDVSHMAIISEDVEAQTTSTGDYAGKVVKKLSMGKIIKLDDHSPLNE